MFENEEKILKTVINCVKVTDVLPALFIPSSPQTTTSQPVSEFGDMVLTPQLIQVSTLTHSTV